MEKKPHRKRGYSDRHQIYVMKNIASLLPALSLARLTFAAPEGSKNDLEQETETPRGRESKAEREMHTLARPRRSAAAPGGSACWAGGWNLDGFQ